MSNEELQTKYDRLLDKTRQVRGIQREYFKYRLGKDLDRARRLERELDQMIAEEVKTKESKQKEIFDLPFDEPVKRPEDGKWRPISENKHFNDLEF